MDAPTPFPIDMLPHLARLLRAFLWCAAILPASLQGQELRLERLIRRDTLPNGLTVIVLENHAVPLATAHIVFRGGAMIQTPELQGVPHLFEHMLFKSFVGSGEETFLSATESTRASYNGATGDEEVSYTLWFPSDQRNANIELLASLVRDPVFKNDNLQRERFVVRNEMERNESEPTFLLRDQSHRALWGEWYPRKNTIGTQLALLGTQLTTLKSIYDTWYVPNNAALVVTGDVKADDIFNAARRHFGRWRRAADPLITNAVPSPPPLDTTFAFVLTHEVQTVTVRMSWRGPALRDDADGARDIETLATLLNAEHSRFQRSLTDGGAFQRTAIVTDINRVASEIAFIGTTTTDRLMDALGLFGSQLRNLSDSTYYDGLDFASAAQRRRVSAALAMEQTAVYASTIGSLWAVGSLGTPTDTLTTASTTGETAARLSAVARKYLVQKPYVIGVLTPLGTQDRVSTTVSQFIEFIKEP